MEDRFNRHHNYSWVLLNEEPFTDEFKRRTSILTKSEISYGLIPREHWVQPSFIDENRAARARATMVAKNIFHGESVSYRNMCRFNAGFFYKHPLLAQYKYYWRVEPYVTYFCDLPYDPFLYMEENDKVYSFVIALEELGDTVPTLWDTVKKFTREYPQYIAPDNSIDFVSDDHGESFNLCHFWSNFELGSLDFWRSPAYTAFFNTLDLSGGFYYERWGDAPVHSIAASLLLNRTQIHFWSDIGYKHDEFQHCPQGSEHKIGKCSCDPSDNFDHQGFASCLSTWEEVRYPNLTLPDAEDDGEMALETPPLVVEERESSD
ncbi:glycosyltransferase family 15 protein [Sistotremastrum niveocremeum HHB9708]|uniref:Glycosyltransferase family 15 protein n=1 Tax=Sistotremastrum niveocremeum HHB9708 TaxID=1314777 RepID=A0A164YPI9_9AGAM|nr:glycosyltransferase family 15 protein [Sistotremastrum niveocremeum HHB9708]